MSLTNDDYNKIINYINITKKIYTLYCELIELEKENKIINKNNIKFIKLKTLEQDENKLLSQLTSTYEKTVLFQQYLNNNNNIIDKNIIIRINIKLNKKIKKLCFKNMLENKSSILNCYKYGQLAGQEFIQSIINDSYTLARYQLNQEIKKCNNKGVKDQLINFKYENLFLELDNDTEIINYIDNTDILLSSDFYYDILFFNNNDKNFKNKIINSVVIEKLLSYINELIKIDDISIKNDDKMAFAIIIKCFIKAYRFSLTNNFSINIDNNLNNSKAISILKEALNDNNYPIKKRLYFKIK